MDQAPMPQARQRVSGSFTAPASCYSRLTGVVGLEAFLFAQGPVDSPFRIDGHEKVAKISDGLRSPQKKEPAFVESVMQHRQDFLLQIGVKIDEQIADGDHIHPGIRRVRHQVVHGENDTFPHIFLDLIRGVLPC